MNSLEINLLGILQVILLQAIFLAFYHGYLASRVDFGYARIYLLTTLIGSLMLPFFPWHVTDGPLIPGAYLLSEIRLAATANPIHASITPSQLLLGSYLMITILLSLRLVLSLSKIMIIVSSSHLTWQSSYYLIETNKMATSSLGPLLFWNPTPGLDAEEYTLIKRHEECHIRQWHSLDVLIVELLKIALWFNPLVYFYQRAIAQNHEYFADLQSARSRKQTYARLLLKSALSTSDLSFTSHFGQINLNKRIMELSKTIARENRPIHYLFTALTFTITAAMLVISSPTQAQRALSQTDASTGDEIIYDEVDQLPSFKGGMQELASALQQTLVYPVDAKKQGTEGKVYVSFVVTKTGQVTEVGVAKSLDKQCDDAAVAAVAQLPAWNPGINQGKPVNVRLVLPITFALDDVEKGQ